MNNFWENETIYFCGDDYFNQLLKDIDEAQRSITIEMYIFNDDILGQKVASHLINARIRGVKVQIIVDGIGSYHFHDKLFKSFKKNNVGIKIYNPLPFVHPYNGKLSFLRRMNVLIVRFGRLNRRNHRKIITIDENILYTGSFNITAEHTRYHFEDPWKDMGVRTTGANVRYAVLHFKRMWKLRDYFKYKKKIKKLPKIDWKEVPLKLNKGLRMKTYYNKESKERVNAATKIIWLMTPYFIPSRTLIRSLGKAAKSGVDVRLLISSKTDVPLFYWLQYFYYEYLLKKGVKVYQYTDSVLHAKNYIVDDYITIGSTNLNHRSMHHDLEVDLVIQGEENKKSIIKHFEEATESQKMITLENLKERTFLDKILSRIFFLFKYWF